MYVCVCMFVAGPRSKVKKTCWLEMFEVSCRGVLEGFQLLEREGEEWRGRGQR